MKYEYIVRQLFLVVPVGKNGQQIENIEHDLARFGALGWELVSIFDNEDAAIQACTAKEYFGIFKRQLKK